MKKTNKEQIQQLIKPLNKSPINTPIHSLYEYATLVLIVFIGCILIDIIGIPYSQSKVTVICNSLYYIMIY